jgi:hypothetical protein
VAALARRSADKSDNERFLFGGLDSAIAVVGAHPGDRLARRMTNQDAKAGQGRSCAPVATQATDLHSLPSTSPVEDGSQGGGDVARILRDTEVWPVEVVMGPRRLPPVIEIEPVVRRLVTGVGVWGIERHSSDLGAVGQESAEFRSCSLAEADFYEASLPGSRFQSCDLTAVQLSKADLTGTRLHGSTLERIHGADSLRGVIIGSDQVIPAALAVFGTLNIVVDDELNSGN